MTFSAVYMGTNKNDSVSVGISVNSSTCKRSNLGLTRDHQPSRHVISFHKGSLLWKLMIVIVLMLVVSLHFNMVLVDAFSLRPFASSKMIASGHSIRLGKSLTTTIITSSQVGSPTRSELCMSTSKSTKRQGSSRAGRSSRNHPSKSNHPTKNQKKSTSSSNSGSSSGNPKNKKEKRKEQSSKVRAEHKSPNQNTGRPQQPGNKRPLPPWQIMSSQDAKQNIQAELQRRDDIQKGVLPSSAPAYSSTITGDVEASSSLLSTTDRMLLNWKRFRPERDVESMIFQGAYLDGEGMTQPPSLGVPEVAFLGRSNVGKSSLLNRISKLFTQANRLDTAVVGKTPGATASVNVYTLEKKQSTKFLMGLVDLPGFGYAKLSKNTKESVENAAERYLGKRKELALGILLVDLRRIPSEDDRAVLAALYDMGIPILVVATKKDKMSSQNELIYQTNQVRDGLGLPDGQPLCVSSKTGEGVKQLWSIIMDACEERVEELRQELEEGVKKAVISEDDPEAYGNIQLDDEGNFLEDEEEDGIGMEGYEWVQSFQYYDDSVMTDQKKAKNKKSESEDAKDKMIENQKKQMEWNKSQKLKNLRKVAKKLQRDGEL